MKILVTGAAGFFGEIIAEDLTSRGHDVIGIDRLDQRHATSFHFHQADIRDEPALTLIFSKFKPQAVIHAAAVLAHERPSEEDLWTSNVDGTRILTDIAIQFGCESLVFLSSNCLWANEFHVPVTEQEPPEPIEIYGKSKLEGERILQTRANQIRVVIMRSPTIVSAGRLGLLGILFQFIEEGRRVYVVGSGNNRYQFVYAPDYCDAISKMLEAKLSGVYNVGSMDVPRMADSFQYVIDQTKSQSRLVRIPLGITIFLLRILHTLRISPLGPYQYRMIASSFEFDTSKIQSATDWRPTKTNNEMLLEAFQYYQANKASTQDSTASAHNRVARGGLIDLLRRLS